MELPSFSEFSSSGAELIGMIRQGQLKSDPREAAKAAWVCLGYALSYLPTTGDITFHATPPMSDSEFCTALESATKNEGMHATGAIPWLAIITTLVQILTKL